MAKSYGGVRGSGVPSSKAKVESTPKEKTPEEKISDVIAQLDNGHRLSAIPFAVADVENRMKTYAEANGIELASDKLAMSPKQIQHALRDTKADAGKTITEAEMKSFPPRISSMDLYYDSEKKNFVYTDGKGKYIIHPNYSVKKNGKHVNFITASRITSTAEFSQRKYKKIE